MRLKFLFLSVLLTILGLRLAAQGSDVLIQRLLEEDRASVEALVLYPDSTRQDILEACLHPEMVVRLGEMQKLTRQEFSDLMATQATEDQKSLWDLARFPDLVARIAAPGGLKDKDLNGYPEEIHAVARWADDAKQPVVAEMHRLNLASASAFESLLKGYPISTQRSFRNLVRFPEVMSILSESLKMTVLVGDMYRRDPAWVNRKLDSLNLVVARQNAEDLQAWRDSLAAHPEALTQFESAGEDFRTDQGASKATEEEVTQYVNVYNTYQVTPTYYGPRPYHYNPYPWWYGYPSWYDYPYWYPTPYWYHCGYYYGAGGAIIVYGLPSPYWTYWYFHHPWHHYHYPVFTHQVLCYYEGHRESPSGLQQEVHQWVQQNQVSFGKDWLKNDGKRPDRIKEYGQFEVSYHNAVAAQPSKAPTQQSFFETHSKDFPNLSQSVNASPRPAVIAQPSPRPKESWPTSVQPVGEDKPKPKPRDFSQPQPKPIVEPPKVQPPKQNFPRSTPAPTYHKDTWQRADPKPTYAPKPTFTPKPNLSQPGSGPKGGIKGR